MSTPTRAGFADAVDYAWAMYEHGPPSSEAVWIYTRLAGWHGDLLRAVWGNDAAIEAEWRAEQRVEARARPHVFVEKLRRAQWPPPPDPDATLLSVDDVGSVLTAAEFALARGWLFGTSLTLSFALMGAGDAARAEAALRRFLKCLAQYCRDNDLPRAYFAAIENGARIGLHAHVVLHVPMVQRVAFRRWVEGWVCGECARSGVDYVAKAWSINRHRKAHSLQHYVLAHYALKGCDVGAVVQSAEDAPDGLPVLLREVLAYEYHDPGVVAFERLHIGASINARARGEWRSKWQRGERDVNFLYPADFVDHVRLRCPVATLGAAELAPVRAAALALADWYERARPLGDQLPPEVQGWQTVVERNVEIVARELHHVVRQFVFAAAIVAPQDRRRARAELRKSVEAAHTAVNENGHHTESLFDELDLPSGRRALRRMAAAEAALRALAARLGTDLAFPGWAMRADLDSLAV